METSANLILSKELFFVLTFDNLDTHGSICLPTYLWIVKFPLLYSSTPFSALMLVIF